MSELSFDLVLAMLNSNQEFPINLEDAWQWLGYSRKDHAKTTLTKNFEQGTDYIIQVQLEGLPVAVTGLQAPNKQNIYLTVDCFKKFQIIANARSNTRSNNSVNYERFYVKALQQKLGGLREVITPAGNIDLLTSTEIIEVKAVKDWKGALGQILVYGTYYPSHSRRIHLFGCCVQSYLDLVKSHCDPHKVLVTYENLSKFENDRKRKITSILENYNL